MLFRRRRHFAVGLAILLAGLVVADHLRPREPKSFPSAIAADFGKYHNQTFRVTRVVDGDTVHIDAADGSKAETVIRLWGVDTPEVHGVAVPMHYGPEASAFTHAAAEGQFVRLELLEDNTRDRHGRLLAYVYLPDGAMLNEQLVELGYAYADTRFAHPHKVGFARLERQARQVHAGLWQKVTPEQMPGWRRGRERPVSSQPISRAGTDGWHGTSLSEGHAQRSEVRGQRSEAGCHGHAVCDHGIVRTQRIHSWGHGSPYSWDSMAAHDAAMAPGSRSANLRISVPPWLTRLSGIVPAVGPV